MVKHKTGFLVSEKANFLSLANTDTITSYSVTYTDKNGLWKNNQVKLPVRENDGVIGKKAESTGLIEVKRKNTEFIHAWPCLTPRWAKEKIDERFNGWNFGSSKNCKFI